MTPKETADAAVENIRESNPRFLSTPDALKYQVGLKTLLTALDEARTSLISISNALVNTRNRLSQHYGCSRYQIGDRNIIHEADKAIDAVKEGAI